MRSSSSRAASLKLDPVSYKNSARGFSALRFLVSPLCPLFLGHKYSLMCPRLQTTFQFLLASENKVTAKWKTLFPFIICFKKKKRIRILLHAWHFYTFVHLFQLKCIQAGEPTTILYLVGIGKFAPSHTKSKQQQHLHLNPGLLRQL